MTNNQIYSLVRGLSGDQVNTLLDAVQQRADYLGCYISDAMVAEKFNVRVRKARNSISAVKNHKRFNEQMIEELFDWIEEWGH